MVGVLDDLLREIRVRIRQGLFEVGDGLAVASFTADGEMRANLCRGDPLLDARQRLTVTAGWGGHFRMVYRACRLHASLGAGDAELNFVGDP